MASRKSRATRALNPGVYRRPDGKLQAYIPIPVDVRFAYGQKKRVISLKTDDADEAVLPKADRDMLAARNIAGGATPHRDTVIQEIRSHPAGIVD